MSLVVDAICFRCGAFLLELCAVKRCAVSVQEQRCACRSRGRVIAIACRACLLSLAHEAPSSLKSGERRGVTPRMVSENRQAKPGASANAAPSPLSVPLLPRAAVSVAPRTLHKLPRQHLLQYRQRKTREGQPETTKKKCRRRAARATRATRRPSRPRRLCLCRRKATMEG